MIKENIHKISVIGDGGWGTTLAIHLAKKKYPVRLWGPFPDYVRKVKQDRYNPKFLPGIPIPPEVILTADLKEAVSDCDLLVFAVPSKYAYDVICNIKKTNVDFSKKIFLSVTKGIETQNFLTISQMVKKELGEIFFAVLSGPNIAREVALGVPSIAVVASAQPDVASSIQKIFNSEKFRIYTNPDVVGVELAGSLKNIIAIACGVCDGLGFGTNTKAAILTRGLTEMARLGEVLGAQVQTFSGLSGLGDLVTTSFNQQSRNRCLGEQLGKGKTLNEILSHMDMVAEGVETVKAVYELSQQHKISMPITDEVYEILYKNKKPSQAVADLMTREMKAE